MHRFAASHLHSITRRIFSAVGAAGAIADEVAGILVNANLAGHDSHGVLRIPEYLRLVERGNLKMDAEPAVLAETATTLLIDGNDGFGHYTARRAMALAIEQARGAAVCCASLVRTGHIGRLGEYAEQAARAGCIGIVTVGWGQTGSGSTTPYGGARGAFGTNPIAFGVPTGDDVPFIVDYATSMVAEGKLRVARSKGEDLPEGYIVDRHGVPSVKPEDFYDGGFLLPFGNHKGYALSMLTCLLGGLSGRFDVERGTMGGAYLQVIDVAAFHTPGSLSAGGSSIPGRHQADAAGAGIRRGAGAGRFRASLPGAASCARGRGAEYDLPADRRVRRQARRAPRRGRDLGVGLGTLRDGIGAEHASPRNRIATQLLSPSRRHRVSSPTPHGISHPAYRPSVAGLNGMVASGHPLASQAGVRIMQAGGNAIDAAIAAAAAVGVVEPAMSGVGGDGFILIFDAATGRPYGVNATGPASARATRERYLARGGIPMHGMPSVSVPGLVDGWLLAQRRFGKLDLGQVLAPAVDLCERGFPVSHKLAAALEAEHESLAADAAAQAVFSPRGRALRAG